MIDANTFKLIFSNWLRFFFLFTPFFALTMFLSFTTSYSEVRRKKMALQTTIAVAVLCITLFFFGKLIFSIFGITLDAFRVGAGALLFLSALRLVQRDDKNIDEDQQEDFSVVPLATPIVVGPATIGTLLVLSGEMQTPSARLTGFTALFLAIITMGILLRLASAIERVLGKRGLNILSKITGLILAALAAQMILMGIKHFFA